MTERGVTESTVESAALAWLNTRGGRVSHGLDGGTDLPRWNGRSRRQSGRREWSTRTDEQPSRKLAFSRHQN
jgi:hypothetical protein